MVITITSLKLNSIWKFFRLSLLAMRILRQTRTQPGFIKIKTTGLGYDHYTMSAWESEEDMRRFTVSGAHQQAMRESRSVASEIATYTYVSDSLPDWNQARKELKENGKVMRFKK